MAGGDAIEEVVERVRRAMALRTPLAIRGGGTKEFLGEAHGGEPLLIGAVRGIVDYDPAELVVTVRAGTLLAEVEALLEAHGQMLAFEPPRFGAASTIGGAIAAGLAGPRRASAGGVRDFVLGAQIVSGRGELLRFGGRVMKNVAGFDVSRLLCGSLGILGPIVELSLKVLPRPAFERTLGFDLGAADAIVSFNRWARQPLPLSATAWWGGQAWVRLSGSAAAVQAATATLGGAPLEDGVARESWDRLRDHRHEHLSPRTPLWRLSVPSTTLPLSLGGVQLMEWAGGLRWLRSDEPASAVRSVVGAAGGTAVLWHGAPGVPACEPLPAAALAIHRRLKAGFDPEGLFNRGRLVPGL
jgi:glycolate oxidase FAD binding subunit